MQISTDSFFGQIQNQLSGCISNAQKNGWKAQFHCLDPTKYQFIYTIFNKFLTKHPQFENCVPLNDSSQFFFNCTSNDETGDYLFLDTYPNNFGMKIMNEQKNNLETSTRWFGFR